MDDSRIVDLYIERDQRAIEQTRAKYSSALRTTAMNILANVQDAEECENDAYLQAWGAIPPHEPRDYLFAFVSRMVRHCALDMCRRAGRQKRSACIVELSCELEQCIPSPSDELCRIEGRELAHAISSFLRSEGSLARMVFVRRYWYCDSIAAICDRFGMGESKVKSMLMRTRKRLKEYLIKEGYDI